MCLLGDLHSTVAVHAVSLLPAPQRLMTSRIKRIKVYYNMCTQSDMRGWRAVAKTDDAQLGVSRTCCPARMLMPRGTLFNLLKAWTNSQALQYVT